MKDDLTDIIESGIRSDFWIEYFEPELTEEIERCKEYLLHCSIDDFKGVQIKAQTLKEILEKPRKDYKDMKGAKDERQGR